MRARGLAAGVAAMLWLAPWSAVGGVVDRIAATVNDEVIALSEIYDLGAGYVTERCGELAVESCTRSAELEVLDSLVLRTLIHQELTRLTMDVSGEDVDRTIDQMGRDYGLEDRAAFRREIERSGVTWDAYRDQLTEQLRRMRFVEAVIRPRIVITDDELLDVYNRTSRGVGGPVKRELEVFSLDVPDDAQHDAIVAQAGTVLGQLRDGSLSWADAVSRFHSGAIGAPDGTMGKFARGELSPTLDAAVWEAPVGGYTQPIDLGRLVLIVRVGGEVRADVRSFEDSKDELRDGLYEQKVEEETERWYQQARRRASVRILLEPPA